MDKFSSDKLRSLREHRKLTQEVLAELCEVDATTISGWEKENGNPVYKMQSLWRELCTYLSRPYVILKALTIVKSQPTRFLMTFKISRRMNNSIYLI